MQKTNSSMVLKGFASRRAVFPEICSRKLLCFRYGLIQDNTFLLNEGRKMNSGGM
jgi:hypothetical protein